MNSFQTFLRRNPWQKLFALLLATLVWATVRQSATRSGIQVQGQDTPTRLFDRLPVRVLTLATNLNNFRVEPAHVAVVLRGRLSLLSRLHPEDIEVYVNLTDLSGDRAVRRPVHVNVSGVQAVLISPEEVLIEPVPSPDNPSARPSTPEE